jgi:hypothetical protein
MDESSRWGRTRYAALLFVCALHVVLVIALLIAAKSRILFTSIPNPIELVFLPRHAVPEISPPPASMDQSKRAARSVLPPSTAIAFDPSGTSAESVGPPVDWGQEARSVAAGIARRGAPEQLQRPTPSSSSPFALPPPHHKGDQIPTSDGRWIVYVSEDCYQVSKSITSITNATNTGIAIQTYCNRRSKEPRGDLFNQLPAYKRLQADK